MSNATEQAARWLADVRPHKEQLDVWADELIADLAMHGGFDVQDYEDKLAALSDIREKLELSADHCRDNALAAIARILAAMEPDAGVVAELVEAWDAARSHEGVKVSLRGEASRASWDAFLAVMDKARTLALIAHNTTEG